MKTHLSVDVTCPLGTNQVVAELEHPADALNAAATRTLNAMLYRIAAELETLFADGSGPDGSGPAFVVEVRLATLDRPAMVTLEVPAGINVADAEDMMIDACAACGLEPTHLGSGPRGAL